MSMMAEKIKLLLFVLMISFILLTSVAMSAVITNVTISSSGSIGNLNSLPLHVEGNKIVDATGRVVLLRGVDYTYFMDTPDGSWMGSDGYIHWDQTVSVEDNFRITDMDQYLDGMAAWNVNLIRVFSTTEWWVRDSCNFRSHLETFLDHAADRGIYVLFTFWRHSDSGPNGPLHVPYPPYFTDNEGIINSQAEFIALWGGIASELKGYDNIIFEFWNEPWGNSAAENSWFSTTQQCINAVRDAGATQLIDIVWDGPITYDFGTGYMQNWDWVSQHPLTDPSNNLIYDMHAYRSNAYDIDGIYNNCAHTMAEVTTWLNVTDTLELAQSKPLMVGEIGVDMYSSNLNEAVEWFDNTLTLFDQYGISYAIFAGPPWSTGSTSSTWAIVYNNQPNYSPNAAGQILKQHLAFSAPPS